MIRLNNSTCAKVSANKIYLNFSYVISVIDTYGNMDMVRLIAGSGSIMHIFNFPPILLPFHSTSNWKKNNLVEHIS